MSRSPASSSVAWSELGEDVHRRGETALQTRVDVRQPLDRIGQQSGDTQIRDDHARRHVAGHFRSKQQADQHRQPPGGQQLDELGAGRLGGGHLQILPSVAVAGRRETMPLVVLAAIHLDVPVRGDRLRRDVGDVAHRILDPLADAPEAARRVANDQAHDRRDDQERRGQHPVQVQHAAKQDGDLQTVLHNDLQRVGGTVPQLRGREREPRYQVALRALVVEGTRHRQQPVEQLAADHMDCTERNPRQEILARDRTEAAQQRQDKHRHGNRPAELDGPSHQGLEAIIGGRRGLAFRPERVDDDAQYGRESSLARRRHEKTDDGKQKVELLVGDVAEQSPVGLPVLRFAGPCRMARGRRLRSLSLRGVSHCRPRRRARATELPSEPVPSSIPVPGRRP